MWVVVQEEEAAGGRQLSQAGKRGDEAGRRPPVEYGVMQFALTRARLGGRGVRVRERRRRNAGEAAQGWRQRRALADKPPQIPTNYCWKTVINSIFITRASAPQPPQERTPRRKAAT